MKKASTERGIQTAPEIRPGVQQTNHLLAIAIDDYQHLPLLNNCVRDVKGLMEVLYQRYDFAPERTTSLFNQEATGEKIARCLEELPGRLGPDDNLLIVYSGHGEYRTLQEEGFWVPVDARQDVTKDRISVPELRMYLNPAPCHHLVMIIDACFSGSIFKRVRSTGRGTATLEEASRWGLTSGRLEPVLDGRPGMHSPFAESLLKQLRDNNNSLRVDQLHSRIVADLEQLGFKEQAPDCGYLDLSGNKRGMFLFQPRNPEPDSPKDVEVQINQSVLRIIQENIVNIQADAIVSSDDTHLSMSGGVSSAILNAAGPKLTAFVREKIKLPVQMGDVVETAAFDLPANYIFHAITLDRVTQAYASDETIFALTRRSMELAEARRLRHIVFPAIGTGSAGAPFESTAQAMVNAICAHLIRETGIEKVTIAIYSRRMAQRKEGLEIFFRRSIRQGAAWSELERALKRLPELMRILEKEQWLGEVEALQKKLLGT